MPIEIESASAPTDAATSLFGAAVDRPLKPRQRMFFTERLAMLLETGAPLHGALGALDTTASDPQLRRVVRALRNDVAEGATFARALERESESFPPSYCSLIAAAEGGGFLPVVLEKLRQLDERRLELRSEMVSALSYPVFLMLFSLLVVVFVLVVVFPKFGEMFTAIRDQLPMSTKVLMAISETLTQHGWFIAPAFVAAIVALWAWTRRPEAADKLDRVVMSIPGLRAIVAELQIVQFLHVLGLSLSNGVSLVDSLRASRDISDSPSFRRLVEKIERNVRDGGRFAAPFSTAPHVPPLVQQMLATGEESGRLSEVSLRVAEFYEREWKRKLALVSKLAEPLLLVFMGGVVGTLVASLILPIFQLSRSVH